MNAVSATTSVQRGTFVSDGPWPNDNSTITLRQLLSTITLPERYALVAMAIHDPESFSAVNMATTTPRRQCPTSKTRDERWKTAALLPSMFLERLTLRAHHALHAKRHSRLCPLLGTNLMTPQLDIFQPGATCWPPRAPYLSKWLILRVRRRPTVLQRAQCRRF